jgi:uncharacterized protein YacL
MKTKNKKQIAWRYGFGIVLVVVGLLFIRFYEGKEFLGFSSVGSWMVYVGFLMLAVITLQLISNKKRIIDERMEFVATKAARLTFVGIILTAFIVMIADGIKTITIPYSYFMSYFVCGIVLFYFVSYKILLRYY